MTDKINTSDDACAMACMLVSNPLGALREDSDGWQKRVNDLIRALRDERHQFEGELRISQAAVGHNQGVADKLRKALERSIWFQSHYAKLLNDYDGGKRRIFANADEWIARLHELEPQPSNLPAPPEPVP